jgi:hypothetical protein
MKLIVRVKQRRIGYSKSANQITAHLLLNGVFIFIKECYKSRNMTDPIHEIFPVGTMAKRIESLKE